MSEAREIRSYEYVNRPYAAVERSLTNDPVGFLQRATKTAHARAELLIATLRVDIAGFELGKDVRIEVEKIDREGHAPHAMAQPRTTLTLRWRAATNAAFFPAMRADLVVYPLSADETQIDLHGFYTPPGGMLGAAADAAFGHRIAEATLRRFLEDVVALLRREVA